MKVVLQHLTKRFPNRNRKIKEEVVAVSDFTFPRNSLPEEERVIALRP